MDRKLLGIEIGGTKLQVAVSDLSGVVKKQLRYNIHAAAGAAAIRAQLEKSIAEVGIEDIAAIGVGFGGPMNWRTGIIETSHQVGGWAGFDIAQWLKRFAHAPVAVDNDANVAALAEAVHGSGKNYDPVFYMTIGSGIGGGVVTGGKIYHGTAPGEVEVGHLRLSKNGDTVESACSGWALNKKMRAHIETHPQSVLAQLAVDGAIPEAALLVPALEKEDSAAQQIVDCLADDLAFALSHVVHLFHPHVIILGGGVSFLGERLRQPIATRLPAYVMNAFLPAPHVQIASLGENVVPIGALELAKQALQSHQKNPML